MPKNIPLFPPKFQKKKKKVKILNIFFKVKIKILKHKNHS